MNGDNFVTVRSKEVGKDRYDPCEGIIAPDGKWIEFPEEAGQLVVWEDERTFRVRKDYSRLFALLSMGTGLLVMMLGILLLVTFFGDSLEEGLHGNGLLYVISGGFFLFLLAMAWASSDCNSWRMAFFTNGIGLLIPQPGYWELFFVPWEEVHTHRHVDHWFLGSILQVGYGGQRLFILEPMKGYDLIDDLVGANAWMGYNPAVL